MVAAKLLDAARAVSLMATSRKSDLEQGARAIFTQPALFGTPTSRRNASRFFSRSLSSPKAFLICAFLLCTYTIYSSHRATGPDGLDSLLPHGRSAFGLEDPADFNGVASNLVIYDYQGLDEEDADNLRFFLAVGVAPDDGNRYVIVAQEQLYVSPPSAMESVADGDAEALIENQEEMLAESGLTALPPLESLPPHVDIVLRPNGPCKSAWGVLGWLLENSTATPEAPTPLIDFSSYQNFILIDSSVRGPFLPAHWPPLVHWSTALLSRIQGAVHMAGATITTDPTQPGPGAPPASLPRPQPRIRSGLVAFDQDALAAIRNTDPEALKCRSTPEDALWYNDAGASAAVLHSGLNIDCLMLRFQNTDWLDKSTWGWKYSNSDVDSGPFQVMFVPLRSRALQTSRAAAAAHQYSMWAIKILKSTPGATSSEGGSKPVAKVPAAKKATATDTATARMQLDAAAAQAAAMALRQQREEKAHQLEEQQQQQQLGEGGHGLDGSFENNNNQGIGSFHENALINDRLDTNNGGDGQFLYNTDDNDDDGIDNGGEPNLFNDEEDEAPQLGDFRDDFETDEDGNPLLQSIDDYSGADDFSQDFAGGVGGSDEVVRSFTDDEEDYHYHAQDLERNPFGGDEEDDENSGGFDSLSEVRRRLIEDGKEEEQGDLSIADADADIVVVENGEDDQDHPPVLDT